MITWPQARSPREVGAPLAGARSEDPLPRCPLCGHASTRLSWRAVPGQPVLVTLEPCGHRTGALERPVLLCTAVVDPPEETSPEAFGRAVP